MKQENEGSPLWHEGKTDEEMEAIAREDPASAIYNLMEDIQCMKEQSSRLASCSIPAHEGLGAVIEQCSGQLPGRWVLGIVIENGAAWVELFDHGGDKVEPLDSSDRTLTEQVSGALKLALERTT